MSRDGLRVLTVEPDAAGSRLDTYLAEAVGSRAAAAGLIEAGLVRVDGQPARKRHLVRAGQVVEFERPASEPERATGPAAPFAVAYEDEHLLVVDKPAGVVVHPARGHRTGTLAQALGAHGAAGGEEGRPGIVHRALKAQIAARELHREYAALVDGHPSARTGTIDAPIGRDRRDRLLVSLDSDVAREARTHFSVVELLGSASLLEVHLDTGRTHQIRVHLAAIGHPVCGDPQYGVAGRFGLRRQFLHAQRLAFAHPISGAPLDVRSALPDDLADALSAARATNG